MGTHLLVNILYVSFAIINSRIIYLIVKNRKIEILVLLLIVFLPFSDVFLQKGIKSYYEMYEMKPKIYDYPQQDQYGKIESLDLTHSSAIWFTKYLTEDNKFRTNLFLNSTSFDNRIRDFLEIKVPDLEQGNRYLRISFDGDLIKTEFIESGTARYKINIQSNNRLFGLYTEIKYQLIDRKRDNKLLAEAITIIFPNEKDNFRNKYLLWGTKNEEIFKNESINNKEIIEKLLEVEHI